jgi:hypothetical protein
VTRSSPTRRVWSVTEKSAPIPMLMDGSAACFSASRRLAAMRASSSSLRGGAASESSTSTAKEGALLAFFRPPSRREAIERQDRVGVARYSNNPNLWRLTLLVAVWRGSHAHHRQDQGNR